jgi:hypothetical protein
MNYPLHSDRWLGALPEPVKNRFFYGMLLSEQILTRYQDYFEAKRWLLNRLTLGSGVLAGLTYKVANDPRAAGFPEGCPPVPGPGPWLMLDPGVALDEYGREIVVPSTSTAAQRWPILVHLPDRDVPISEIGKVLDAAKKYIVQEGKSRFLYLLIEIRYDPVKIDHEPVRAGTCPPRCEPGAIREGYVVRFRILEKIPPVGQIANPLPSAPREELPRSDPGWPPGALADVFPPEPLETVRHRQAAQKHDDPAHPKHDDLAAPAKPPTSGQAADPCELPESWVPLGVLQCEIREGEPPQLYPRDAGRYYRQIFGNDALSRLVVGLAERVDEAARVRVLIHDGAAGASGEGQTADVYHELVNPLVVRVVDSTGRVPAVDPNGNILSRKDLSSIRVQFDRLSESTDAELLKMDGTAVSEPLELDTTPGPNLGTVRVWWKLGKRPGLHTVAARIVKEKDTAYPPFHPGSQVLFHATARPTAPTIVGVSFDQLWCMDECGKYHWNERGRPLLRLDFSRNLEIGYLKENLRVWAVHRRRRHGPMCIPRRIEVDGSGNPHAIGKQTDPVDPDKVCWQVEFGLPELVRWLRPWDILRVAVLLQAPDDPERHTVWAEPSNNYPKRQVLDPTFDGSYLVRPYREYLWRVPRYEAGEEEAALRESESLLAADTYDEQKFQPISAAVSAVWDCFQPRERCLPSGDGIEGGVVKDNTDFHKTFEFRLPCC